MRDLLLARIRPLVERLANDITDVALARVEAELSRLPEMLEVALSAYLHDSSVRDSVEHHHGHPAAAKPHEPTLFSPLPLMTLAPPAPDTTGYTTFTHPAAREPIARPPRAGGRDGRVDKTALTSDGRRPPTCKLCGFIGGRATGCGTSHETQKAPALASTVLAAIEPSLQRSADEHRQKFARGPLPRKMTGPGFAPLVSAKPLTAIVDRDPRPTAEALARSKARIARIAASATTEPRRAGAPPRDDNENAEERWSPQQIDEERKLAEANKHAGELPTPRSSYEIRGRAINFDEIEDAV